MIRKIKSSFLVLAAVLTVSLFGIPTTDSFTGHAEAAPNVTCPSGFIAFRQLTNNNNRVRVFCSSAEGNADISNGGSDDVGVVCLGTNLPGVRVFQETNFDVMDVTCASGVQSYIDDTGSRINVAAEPSACPNGFEEVADECRSIANPFEQCAASEISGGNCPGIGDDEPDSETPSDDIPAGCPGGPAGPLVPGTECPSTGDDGSNDGGTSDVADPEPVGFDGDDITEDEIKNNPIYVRLNEILNFLSVGVGIVVTISIVVAGFQYMTSRGEPGKTQAAVNRLTQAAVAMFLYIFGVAILNWLIPGGLFS